MATQQPLRQGPLSPYRILDMADAKGTYCSKILADLGADVIKIEPPEGDSSRRLPPFAKDVLGPDRSLYFLYHNTSKRGITLNLETEDGRHLFRQLVATADVLVETFPPGYMDSLGLGYSGLRALNPRLIMVSITAFGQSGPRRDWQMAPIVGFALSGGMRSSGLPEKPNLDAPHPLAYQTASIFAGIGITMALYGRGPQGQGQHIDISIQEAAVHGLDPWALPSIPLDNTSPSNPTRGGRSTGFPIYPCQDGFVRVIAHWPRGWEALMEVLGHPEALKGPEWQSFTYQQSHLDEMWDIVSPYTQQYTMNEISLRGQAMGASITPVLSPAGFVSDPHTQARGFFVEVEHPEVGKALYPGIPYRLPGVPLSAPRPAPRLGEHNEEVYCDELKLTAEELAALRANGVV